MTTTRFLFLAGGAPFLLLGVAHAMATPLTIKSRRGLTPRDPALPRAMAESALLLTSRTDVWRAWVGFNLSHSLGAIVFAAFIWVTARNDDAFAADSRFAVPLAVVVAAGYLAIGLKYWFRTPIVGIAISLVCFAAAYSLMLAVH